MKRAGAQWLDRTLVRSPIYIGLCTSEKQYQNELKELGIPREEWDEWVKCSDGARTHILTQNTKGLCCIVCIDASGDTKPILALCCLVHEAVHIWQEVRRVIGEDSPSSEFEAYAIQGISESLISAYRIPKRKDGKVAKKKGKKKGGCK